jgi:hypothetical protein
MDRDPIKTAARISKRETHLGPGPHICIYCGYSNPLGLIKPRKSLLEDHHEWGRRIDPKLTVLVCRNCHAELTEGLRRAGVPMTKDEDPVAEEIHLLEADAVRDERHAAALRRRAEQLRISRELRRQ